MKLPRNALRRSLFAAGAALILFYLASLGFQAGSSRLAVRSFEASRAAAVALPSPAVDVRLWAAKRVAAYEEALARRFSPPIAVLRAPRIGIEVPVFEGTDEFVLNRGVGRISGTARPGEAGNLGIAGHRDGFFRALKDIKAGDSLTLDAGGSIADYVVEEIRIVDRKDVSVLAPTPAPFLTLVTCYPFYFAGDAPRRYIVRCALRTTRSLTKEAM